MDRLEVLIRRLLCRDDTRRARMAHARSLRRAELSARADEVRFEKATRCAPNSGRVLLARTRSVLGEPYWCGLDVESLLSTHMWITGASRSGKSVWICLVLLQFLGRGVPALVLDLKGELSEWLVSVVIPALCARPGGEALLEKLLVVRPFGPAGCDLRLTAEEPGVPRAIQAMNLASALEEALGDELGTRMSRALLRMASLAIELREPLTVVRTWLSSPMAFVRAAGRSQDPDTREYARAAFPRESKPALAAALSRIDSFLFLDDVRRAIEAPRCVDLCRFDPGSCVIVDLGHPPAGADRAQRFWAGALTGRIVRGVLSRPVTADSPRALWVLEEIQDGLSPRQAHQLSRAIALMGFKQVYCAVSHQGASQLSAVDANLVRTLRTNVGIELCFRAAREDARLLADAMPIPDGVTSGAARAQLVRDLMQLQPRECVLWLRSLGLAPQRVRSPRLDLDALRRTGAAYVEAVGAKLRHGQPHRIEPSVDTHGENAGLDGGADLLGLLEDPGSRHPRLG
jgi:hypothetical protein